MENATEKPTRLVIGNWKMNASFCDSKHLLQELLTGAEKPLASQAAVCVPFPYLSFVAEMLADSPISWGAQDLSPHEKGAYTGQVSASMLTDFNCHWVIVGHSERRIYQHETDQEIAEKARVALNHGLTPIVCVGETKEQYQAGQTLEVISRQLAPLFALEQSSISKIVIAYEPIWAIGTGLTATPEQAQTVHQHIRQSITPFSNTHVPILYGGSVKSSNAASLFAQADIDGALVGGASLIADEFLGIINA